MVSRSPSCLHLINTFETIDENIERILFEMRYPDEEIRKLTNQYTFRLCTNGMIFDARDIFEVVELCRCFPDHYKLKMYRYTAEELKQRHDQEKE